MTFAKQREDVKEYILNQLKDEQNWLKDSFYCDFEGCDVPNRFLNNDYFIIGTYKAKKWLGEELFEAVQTIQDYEKDNFGETYTDLSDPEKIANMLSYILGNEILSDSAALQFRWNSPVNKYTVELMINELELTSGIINNVNAILEIRNEQK
tara:strand:+ start:1082 stop:1537 length:456 start_codon:yes stop_codon:yes gene_type:complete